MTGSSTDLKTWIAGYLPILIEAPMPKGIKLIFALLPSLQK